MKPKLLFQLFNPQAIGPSKDSSLLLFRIIVSLSMINTHGMKKVLNFQETAAHIPDPMGLGGEISALIAIGANIVAPLLVIFGLGTRLACLLILSVTLMGFFVVHGSDPWAVRDVPLMYSLAYLLIFFVGPGKYAIDQKIFNRLQS